jgi:hypothetical protein
MGDEFDARGAIITILVVLSVSVLVIALGIGFLWESINFYRERRRLRHAFRNLKDAPQGKFRLDELGTASDVEDR